MSDSLLIPDIYLLALAKYSKLLFDKAKIETMLPYYYKVNKYSKKTFIYINLLSSFGNTLPKKIEQKKALQKEQILK